MGPDCPTNSVCNESFGTSTCTCKPGFTTRIVDIPFKPTNGRCEDIDECLNIGACPKHTICKNNIGSFYCICKPGYRAAAGEIYFSNSSQTCTAPEDLDLRLVNGNGKCSGRVEIYHAGAWGTVCDNNWDEVDAAVVCRQMRCGSPLLAHRRAHFGQGSRNILLDNVACTGNESQLWDCNNRGLNIHNCFHPQDAGVTCTELEERCNTGLNCPKKSVCLEDSGSPVCNCKPGYRNRNRESSFKPEIAQSCDDIDECAENPEVCGPHTVCTNTPGNYSCSCLSGFIFSAGGEPLNGTIHCTDIDECMLNSEICGPHTTCTNTPGSHRCRCRPGFIFSAERDQVNGTISCTEVTLNCNDENMQACQNQSNQSPLCYLLDSTYNIIRDPCEQKNATITLQNVTEEFRLLLEQAPWSNLSTKEVSTAATIFLKTVESTILASLATSEGKGSQIKTPEMDIETKVIKDDCNLLNTVLQLNAKEERMDISCRTVTGNGGEASGGVAFISFENMETILNANFFKDKDTESSEALRDVSINARVVSGQITSEEKSSFSDAVNFTLKNIKEKDSTHKVICVFWNSTKGGGSWSREGCKLQASNTTHTECSCDHLSSFTIIMAVREVEEDFVLTVLTYVGLTFSLLCLGLAILTFLFCRSSCNTNTSIHLQLCVCLFLAELLLLTGVKSTNNTIGCAIIAGLLHYLFLACFSWMFVEGMMLFLTVRNLNVVNYFNTRKIKTLHMSLFGYGLPALIVIISAGSRPGSYGTNKYCWLDPKTGLVWSFLGPVCAFLLINSSLFTATLCILGKKLSTVNMNVSTIQNSRLLTFKASAQLLILGCTWIIGLFQIGSASTVMAYLFTIINCLQGPFIFLVHCILNKQVREEYLRLFRRYRKPASESQSSALIVSTVPIPMKSMTDVNHSLAWQVEDTFPTFRSNATQSNTVSGS
ncbi:adhesion G protein-coupled receptor E3-like [Ambystoma mexicanum]|uniref:adhesion G protein-coupled receptor E3-like n=1 Tax=Ambystoma mexicanum TaxID=8296 RepID=UPI0037E7159E